MKKHRKHTRSLKVIRHSFNGHICEKIVRVISNRDQDPETTIKQLRYESLLQGR